MDDFLTNFCCEDYYDDSYTDDFHDEDYYPRFHLTSNHYIIRDSKFVANEYYLDDIDEVRGYED